MSSKSLTVDQKLDLVLDKVGKIEVTVGKLETTVGKLETTVGKLETSVKTIEENQVKMQKSIDDLSDMASKTLILAGTSADRVTHIENHLSETSNFTPFTSGAFAT